MNKVYCNECKFSGTRGGCLANPCLKDTPCCQEHIYAQRHEKNKNNDCPDFEPRGWWDARFNKASRCGSCSY